MPSISLNRLSNQVLIVFAAVLLFATPTIGQPVTGGNPILKSAEAKYVETANGTPCIQLQLNNENGEKFSILIRDEQGVELYREISKEKKFDKKYILDESLRQTKLTITVFSLKDHESQSFEINSQTKVLQDVVIRKL